MVLGSKASTYAVLAAIEIARHDLNPKTNGSMRAAEIAKQFSLPAAYAAKVMTQLVRANILHSDRGPRGGFRLTRAPEQISLLEIVEAVDGQFEVEPGMLSSPEAQGSLAGVNKVFAEVVQETRKILGGKNIGDFVKTAAVPTPEPSMSGLPQLTH